MQKAPSTMESSRTNDSFKEDRRRQHEPLTFGESVGQFLSFMFCCISGHDDEVDEKDGRDRTIEISAPTDFRREEMDIAGLTEEQSKMFREKQRRDAERMWNQLQPLRSSPSGTFAERPADTYPTYEAFTQPRAAPDPGSHTTPHHLRVATTPPGVDGAPPATEPRGTASPLAPAQPRAVPDTRGDRVPAPRRPPTRPWSMRAPTHLGRAPSRPAPDRAAPPLHDVEMALLIMHDPAAPTPLGGSRARSRSPSHPAPVVDTCGAARVFVSSSRGRASSAEPASL